MTRKVICDVCSKDAGYSDAYKTPSYIKSDSDKYFYEFISGKYKDICQTCYIRIGKKVLEAIENQIGEIQIEQE